MFEIGVVALTCHRFTRMMKSSTNREIPLRTIAIINHQSTSKNTIMSAIDSYDEAYAMVNSITAKLQDDDDYNPSEWKCSKCHFLNNDDESSCQNTDVRGNPCSTPRYSSVTSTWGSAFLRKYCSKSAANNEPLLSGSSNEAVCESSTAGNSSLVEKKKTTKKTPSSRMLRELESTLGNYWRGSGNRGSRRSRR
jgi:hypothetical protein